MDCYAYFTCGKERRLVRPNILARACQKTMVPRPLSKSERLQAAIKSYGAQGFAPESANG